MKAPVVSARRASAMLRRASRVGLVMPGWVSRNISPLVRSSDSGASWTTTPVGGTGNLNAMQFVQDVAGRQ